MDERTVTEEILSGRRCRNAVAMRRRHDRRRGVERIERPCRRRPRPAVCRGRRIRARVSNGLAAKVRCPAICEIPLETFFAATDRLIRLGCRRIVYVGTSKGAEASLLAAAHDPRIDAVVAISPTSVVWGNIGPGRDGIRLARAIVMDARGDSLAVCPKQS